MASTDVGYHMSNIAWQVSVSYVAWQLSVSNIAWSHVLKITIASVRHIKISTCQYHVINTRVIIFKLIISTRIMIK